MWPKLFSDLLEASLETLAMSFIAAFFAIILGLSLGVFLASHHRERGPLYRFSQRLAGILVNMTRSFPFVILVIALMPFTRWIVGTTIGWLAAVVPLAIGAIPLYARLSETALREVPSGLFEAGLSMGASPWQIYWKITVAEALPSLIQHATTVVVALIGFSAIAGTIGGGGLGALAYHYGFQRFDTSIMLYTVCLLVLIVQSVQWIGDKIRSRLRCAKHTGL